MFLLYSETYVTESMDFILGRCQGPLREAGVPSLGLPHNSVYGFPMSVPNHKKYTGPRLTLNEPEYDLETLKPLRAVERLPTDSQALEPRQFNTWVCFPATSTRCSLPRQSLSCGSEPSASRHCPCSLAVQQPQQVALVSSGLQSGAQALGCPRKTVQRKTCSF